MSIGRIGVRFAFVTTIMPIIKLFKSIEDTAYCSKKKFDANHQAYGANSFERMNNENAHWFSNSMLTSNLEITNPKTNSENVASGLEVM